MNTLLLLPLQIAEIVAGWLLAGLDELKVSATPAFLKYIELLKKLTTKGIAGPLVLAVLAFLGYGVTTTSVDVLQYWGWVGPFWSSVASLLLLTEGVWKTMLALAGIVSFVYVLLCGVLASPVGVLTQAASPTARNVPSAPVTVSWGTLAGSILTEIRDARIGLTNALQAGVTEYVWQVKFALTFVGATYFFAAAFPGMRTMILLFILGALILTAMRGFKSPTASLLRFAVCATLLWCVVGKMFPSLNPLTQARGAWHFINAFIPANWTKPAFWLFLIAVAPFAYVAYKTLLGLAKKATAQATGEEVAQAPATSVHSDHHGSSGGGSGKLMATLIVALIALIVVVTFTKVLNFHEGHNARVDDDLVRHKISEFVEAETRRRGVSTPTVARTTAPPTGVALTIPDGLRDLKNPKVYELTLTTNWSEEFPRPVGQSIRIHPSEIPMEMRMNGKDVRTGVPGAYTSVKGTYSFALRAKDGNPIPIVVGVGWATSQ